MWKVVILASLAFFNVLHSSNALECFSCDSTQESSNCTNPANGTTLTETCADKSHCTKITGTFKIGRIEKYVINRKCTPESVTCKMLEDAHAILNVTDAECSSCKTDLCNASSSLTSTAALGALALIFIAVFNRA